MVSRRDYPSVTELLNVYRNFPAGLDRKMEIGAYRGTEVHRLCMKIAEGLWIPDSAIPKYIQGYVKSFTTWLDEAVEKVVAVEPELFSDAYKIKGHPDLIVVFKGDKHNSIPDLKTSTSEQALWEGQLTGYDILAEQNGYGPLESIGSLRLHKEGKIAKFNQYERDGRIRAAFLGAVSGYHAFGGK